MADPLDILEKYTRYIPVDIDGMAREFGIIVERKPEAENISGWIEKKGDGGYLIVVNSRHSQTRQRFTIAHELGHYIYHRDLIGRGVGDTRAYRSSGTPFQNPLISIAHERQANSFAANALMPRDRIKEYRDKGVNNPLDLAKSFGVSEEAMRIRLGLPNLQEARLF